jgi:PAS domain-containing protein
MTPDAQKTEAQKTDAQQDLLTTLMGVRDELSQVRQAALDLKNPEFVQELGLSMLEMFAKQIQAVIALGRTPPPPSRTPQPPSSPPVGFAEAAHGLSLAPDDSYDHTLASIPVPGLVVNADGLIVAANVPAEELFGKALLNTPVDDLAPERHRGQHAYWRKGFVSHPSMRLMGRGRSVPGVRADGVEMDLDVALGPYPAQPGFTLALMVPRSIRG